MIKLETGVRLSMAATMLGGVLWLTGCADHETEATRTTQTTTTQTFAPMPAPPQTLVTTTHTQQYPP
jgi:hypothetical protein